MKTHSTFDYDLWTTDENGEKKYWTRIKSSGEVTEVSEEIFRYMNSEDKKIRRQITETINASGTVYSLDATNEDGLTLLDTINDSFDLEASYMMHSFFESFKETLPDIQRTFFSEVFENGQTIQDYAIAHGISGSAAYKVNDKINKKLKKFALGG
ncbi:MAG: hypothetical protein PHV32_01295 [Eubacteriales bacterium]|nr:hypothetical protein [Eubacteriales bacterium]